jgi:hypothetical protein
MRNEAELRSSIEHYREQEAECRRSAEVELGMLLRVLTDYWEVGDRVTATLRRYTTIPPMTQEFRGTDQYPQHGLYYIILGGLKVSPEDYTFENHTFNERGLPR